MAASGVGLALLSLSLMLAGLGMFCFDGSLTGSFSDSTSSAPDCFLINVNRWMHPKVWLLANLFGAIVLGACAHTVAYGFLKGRAWTRTLLLKGALLGIAYFAALAAVLAEFRTLGLSGAALLTCAVVGHFLTRR